MSESYERVISALEAHGSKSAEVRQGRSMWQCPAHADNNPSLEVKHKGDKTIVACYAKCQTDDVVQALGLQWSDLFDGELDLTDKTVRNRSQLVRSYLYEKGNGDPYFYVDRYYPKVFRQRMPGVEPVRDLSDREQWKRLGLHNVKPIVYHFPRMIRHMKPEPVDVWWLDGEKDVETAERHGLVATCPPGFAKWDPVYATALKQAGVKSVVIVVDQDKEKPDGTLGAGQQAAIAARLGFRSVGLTVRVVSPAVGADLTDHFAAGYGVDDFVPDPSLATRPRGTTGRDLMAKEFDPVRWAVQGILPTGLTILAGSPKVGKALAVDTPILTTDGWTTMAEVRPGQQVFALDGTPTKVIAATKAMHDRECYRVTTRSGAVLVADADHQWQVHRRGETRVLTTRELFQNTDRRWLLPTAECLHTVNTDLPIDPWVLGYWLGNGSRASGELSCNPADRDEVLTQVRRAGYSVGRVTDKVVSVLGLAEMLRNLGVLDDKHIPEPYLLAGTQQRMALLTGLCDADSYCNTNPNGSAAIELTQVSRRIIDGAAFLARSLGLKTRIGEGRATLNGRDMGPKYRMTFAATPWDAPVSFTRRKRALPKREVGQRSLRDAVASVEPVDSVPVRCIQVAHPSGTYLAGPELTVTHNSWICLDLACAVAAGGRALGGLMVDQGSTLYLAREDTYRRIQSRLALIMGGNLDDVPKAMEVVPLDVEWIGGEEGLANMTEWAEEVRNPRLVVIDTLAKMEPEMGEDRSRGAYAGNYSMMARYKAWADTHNCALVLVHHDNKTKADKTDGWMDDPFTQISGTRAITGAADSLLFLESKRFSTEGRLHITGRDVVEQSLEMRKIGPLWTVFDLPEQGH